ncbi:hypothetical protein B0H11DRAFT_1698348 [Mycena galericulata]|nr:hypothetical protein B0H11DRAFT_1698348 [Mycena galericulata]
MFLPFLSTPSRLSRRKGGGKSSSSSSGKASSSSGSKSGTGKSSTSSNNGKGTSSTSGKSIPISSGGTKQTVTAYSNGGGKLITIPSGQLFAGRTEGGATRNQIWGSRAYGSGYPGFYSRGVSGRGFPFYFWPLAWGTGEAYGKEAAYMHTEEYGQPDNATRPGGPQASTSFQSNSTGTMFRIVADNATVAELMADISANCSQWLVPESITNATTAVPTPNNASSAAAEPEQVVQYYRASSVALTLDGYNNSAVFAPENFTADTPLPTGTDSNLLECLNATIGLAVPLVDSGTHSAPNYGYFALVVLLFGFAFLTQN